MNDTPLVIPEDYATFHARVVDACVDLMLGRCINDDGSTMNEEELRYFFGTVCSYEVEFKDKQTPEEVAEAQWEAIT